MSGCVLYCDYFELSCLGTDKALIVCRGAFLPPFLLMRTSDWFLCFCECCYVLLVLTES